MKRLRSYRWTSVQSFRQEVQAFARAVGGERTPLTTGRDGLKAVEIAHAVYGNPADGSAGTRLPKEDE